MRPNGKVVVSAIAGATGPVSVSLDKIDQPKLSESCSSSLGSAVPAIRIKSLVDAFGESGQFHSICDDDFGPALDNIGRLILTQSHLKWCLPWTPEDREGDTPRLNADCRVVTGATNLLEPCQQGDETPCFEVTKDMGREPARLPWYKHLFLVTGSY